MDLFLKQISDLWKKLWTFQYAAGFRGPGILIKRSTIVDLSVYAAWLRGPDISQNIQKIFKKYPKIDYRAFASSRRHYAADNHTARDIHNFGPFWVVKIQGGAMPPWPPLIKISLHAYTYTRTLWTYTQCMHPGSHQLYRIGFMIQRDKMLHAPIHIMCRATNEKGCSTGGGGGGV